MAEFFFHFFDGKDWSRDGSGIELASAEAAYIEAVAGARDMWPELLADRCNPMRCAFEIADREGNALFRVEFSELVEHCRDTGGTQTSDHIHRAIEETNRRASLAREELKLSFANVRSSLAEANNLLVRLGQFERAPVPSARPQP